MVVIKCSIELFIKWMIHLKLYAINKSSEGTVHIVGPDFNPV